MATIYGHSGSGGVGVTDEASGFDLASLPRRVLQYVAGSSDDANEQDLFLETVLTNDNFKNCTFTWISFALVFAYGIILAWSLIYLVRLCRSSHASPRVAQKIFLSFTVAQSFFRILYFFLWPFQIKGLSKGCTPSTEHRDSVFMDFFGLSPACFFLSAFSMYAFTFGRLHRSFARTNPAVQLRFKAIVSILLGTNILLYISMLLTIALPSGKAAKAISRINTWSLTVGTFVVASIFLYFAVLLYKGLQAYIRLNQSRSTDDADETGELPHDNYNLGGNYIPPLNKNQVAAMDVAYPISAAPIQPHYGSSGYYYRASTNTPPLGAGQPVNRGRHSTSTVDLRGLPQRTGSGRNLTDVSGGASTSGGSGAVGASGDGIVTSPHASAALSGGTISGGSQAQSGAPRERTASMNLAHPSLTGVVGVALTPKSAKTRKATKAAVDARSATLPAGASSPVSDPKRIENNRRGSSNIAGPPQSPNSILRKHKTVHIAPNATIPEGSIAGSPSRARSSSASTLEEALGRDDTAAPTATQPVSTRAQNTANVSKRATNTAAANVTVDMDEGESSALLGQPQRYTSDADEVSTVTSSLVRATPGQPMHRMSSHRHLNTQIQNAASPNSGAMNAPASTTLSPAMSSVHATDSASEIDTADPAEIEARRKAEEAMIESLKNNPMTRILRVAGMCVLCFVVRVTLLPIITYYGETVWQSLLCYFLLAEIIPDLAMLRIFDVASTPTSEWTTTYKGYIEYIAPQAPLGPRREPLLANEGSAAVAAVVPVGLAATLGQRSPRPAVAAPAVEVSQNSPYEDPDAKAQGFKAFNVIPVVGVDVGMAMGMGTMTMGYGTTDAHPATGLGMTPTDYLGYDQFQLPGHGVSPEDSGRAALGAVAAAAAAAAATAAAAAASLTPSRNPSPAGSPTATASPPGGFAGGAKVRASPSNASSATASRHAMSSVVPSEVDSQFISPVPIGFGMGGVGMDMTMSLGAPTPVSGFNAGAGMGMDMALDGGFNMSGMNGMGMGIGMDAMNPTPAANNAGLGMDMQPLNMGMNLPSHLQGSMPPQE